MKDKKIFRPNTFPFQPHECSKLFCDPLNNFGLFQRFEISQDFSDTIYICKFGQIHDCSTSNCGIDEVCGVSGISKEYIMEFSSYDKHDSRTWTNVLPQKYLSERKVETLMKKYVPDTVVKPKTYQKSNSVKDAYQRVELIVETILYSLNRKKINEEKYNQRAKKIKREKDQYISECAEERVPVNLVKLSMLDCKSMGNIHVLKILKRDQNVINRYTRLIMQFYEHATKYIEDKVSPESIALGVLYKMQQGMIVDNVVLIPVEEFLIENLPLMNDLNKLKIEKKKYTLGERLIFQTFENARKRGVSNQNLALREEVLEEQNFNELGSVVHCKIAK
jgi:hypothetical protein